MEVDAGQRTVELGVTEGEEAAVGAHEVVAQAVGGGGDGHDVSDVLAEVGQVAVELGVTQGADATVGRHHPVTLGAWARGYAHDGAGGGRGRHAAERLCRSGTEDLAVAGGKPVPGRRVRLMTSA